jgi:hypothetical protein
MGLQAVSSETESSEASLRTSLKVWLTSLHHPGKVEFGFAEHITSQSARVMSVQPWQPGESVLVSLPPELSTLAQVIYCHHQPNGQFALRVRFLDPSPAWADVLPNDVVCASANSWLEIQHLVQ